MKKIIYLMFSLLFFFTLSCEVLDNSDTENGKESFDKELLMGSWYYEGTYSSESEIVENIAAIEMMSMATEWLKLNYIVFSEEEFSQYYWFDGMGVYSDTSLSYQYQLNYNEITFSVDSINKGQFQVKHIENNMEHIILFDEENQIYHLFNKSNNLNFLLENTTVSSDYEYLDFLIF